MTMSPDQSERLVSAFEDMANTNSVIAEEFQRRGKVDDAIVEKWRVDNELRQKELELREREYARLNIWREEDLERQRKRQEAEIAAVLERFAEDQRNRSERS